MSEIIDAAGMLLLALESPPKFLLMRHHNRWDLPKGHAESGEEILTTALRETEEETGLRGSTIVVDPDFRFVLEYEVKGQKRGNYRKRVTYFIGYLPAIRRPVLTEHTGYQWWSWPCLEPIQAETVDPLLSAASQHFETYPQRLKSPTT